MTEETTAAYQSPVEAGVVIAGRYTLVQRLGEGGMGEVWIARQSEPVKRQLALKLIKAGMDSKSVLARFEAERQALALMDHPNIAKVLDGGMTPEGRPYFVMELVNGLPLTKFCDEAKLDPRERLELFVPICQAVQHAHQKGIVHRDLKPTNILVTLYDGRAVPKIIDFGVAKATGGKLTDETLNTQFGAVVGTLDYMSPEQAGLTGIDIDTRSDIYSLGVVLYELLTGLKPIDGRRLRQAALAEMVRILQEEEPSRPSTRLSSDEALPALAALRHTEPKRLMAMLRGELDWVVMKCLEKDRNRRYDTANGLARDIQRYLADEPVEARPPSARYRMAKFLRRNRGAVVAASLVLLAMICGMIGTTLGMVRAVQARQAEADQRAVSQENERKAIAAAEEERKAKVKAKRAVDRYVETVKESELLNDERFQPLRKKLLNDALGYYQEFIRDHQRDPQARRELAKALHQLGWISAASGSSADAIEAFHRVIDLLVVLDSETPGDLDFGGNLGNTYINLGRLQHTTGDITAAMASYQRALIVLLKLVDANPTANRLRYEMALCHNNLGNVLRDLGQTDLAPGSYQRAIAVSGKLVEESPANIEYEELLALGLANLGNMQIEIGQRDAAQASCTRALALSRRLADENRGVSRLQNRLAFVYSNLGKLQQNSGDLKTAQDQLQQALVIREQLVSENPNITEYLAGLAENLNDFADLHMLQGNLGQATAGVQRAVEIWQRLADEHPNVTEHFCGLARAYDNLANLCRDSGDPEGAVSHCRRALEFRQKLGDEHPQIALFQRDLAVAFDHLGDSLSNTSALVEAQECFVRAVALMEQLTAEHPGVTTYQTVLAGSHLSLGSAYHQAGDVERALANLQQAAEIWQKLAEQDPSLVACRTGLGTTLHNLGIVREQMGNRDAALADHQKSLDIRRSLVTEKPDVVTYQADLAAGHLDLGHFFLRAGDRDSALAHFKQAISLREDSVHKSPENVAFKKQLAENHQILGIVQQQLGDYQAAISSWRQELVIEQGLADSHPTIATYQVDAAATNCNLANLLSATRDVEGSLSFYGQAVDTLQTVLAREPNCANGRLFLRNSLHGRASALKTLGRHIEAAGDWQLAIELDDGPMRFNFRLSRADALARAGDHIQAAIEAGELAALPNLPGGPLYNLACVFGVSSAAAKDDEALASRYARQSIELLDRAVAAGFFANPANLANLKKDPDFDSLLERDDFRMLLSKLDAGASKQQP